MAGATLAVLFGATAALSASVLGVKALLILPAIVVAVIITFVPYSMLYMVVGTIPVNVEIVGPITVARLAIVFAFCVAIVQGLRRQAPIPRVFIWPEGTLAAAFFIWMLIGTLVNGVTLFLYGTLVILATIFFVVLNYVDNRRRLFNIILFFTLIGAAQAALVLAEAKFGFSPFGGWQAKLAEGQAQGEVRVTGSSVHPIFLAGFFQIIVGFSVLMAAISSKTVLRIGFLLITVLALLGWWFAFARSSWIGMGLMIFSGMVLVSRPTRIVAIIVGSIGFFVLWMFDFSPSAAIRFAENFGTVQSVAQNAGLAAGSESFSWRMENWIAAVGMFADNPVFGVGLDESLGKMLEYLPNGAVAHKYIPVAVPHNMFLQVLAEGGGISFTLFVAIWVMAFRSSARAMGNPALRPFAIAILAVMLGQIGTFMFNPTPREIWFSMGLGMALGRIDRQLRTGRTAKESKPAPAFLTVARDRRSDRKTASTG